MQNMNSLDTLRWIEGACCDWCVVSQLEVVQTMGGVDQGKWLWVIAAVHSKANFVRPITGWVTGGKNHMIV